MKNSQYLRETYQQAAFKIAGSGARNIGVLKDALKAIPPETESDMYGTGEIIEDFQEKFMKILGKESAFFFPSGTMAQQIALRLWSDEKKSLTIAYHPLAHLEIHEQDGLKEIHHIKTILLGEADRLITLADIQQLKEPVACILIELPQREIGGQLPSFEELKAISDYCRNENIPLHLDGARLWETLPYYQKSPAEICQLFDTVYVSFYKGLGGIAGAILAGPTNFMGNSKIWKRRYGGDLISLYPYILSADYYYEKRIGKMSDYYHDAVKLAARFNKCPGVATIPEIPVTNMFHVHFPKAVSAMEVLIAEVQEKTGIGIAAALRPDSNGRAHFEISVGDSFEEIPETQLEQAFKLLAKKLRSIN